MGVVTGAAFNGGTITRALAIAGTQDVTQLTVSAPANADQDVVVIHADASDTANTHFTIDQHGNLTIASGGSFQEAILRLEDNTSGNPGLIVLDTYLGIQVLPEASSHALLALVPKATHTGRLLTATDSGGVEGLAIIPDAYLVIKRHSAPADAALAAGECALWFDQTNGAAKLMVKGKSANGTVVAASIALA